MKNFKLNKIVKIQSGLVLSRVGAKQLEFMKKDVAEKVSSIETNRYKTVTLRSITDMGNLDLSQCDDFESKEILPNKYLTQKDDILVRLFTPLKCCLITQGQENIVVPSQFAIFKLKEEFKNIILPEYLHLIMQSNNFTAQIQKLEESFQLRSIKTSSIEKAEILIPSIEKQKKYIGVYKLMKQEECLMTELLKQQKTCNELTLEKLIKGEI